MGIVMVRRSCLGFLCSNGCRRGVPGTVTLSRTFSFSLSDSEGLNENWTGSNLFTMRSHSGDFYVCIKPKRMVMCVPVFGKVIGSMRNPAGGRASNGGEEGGGKETKTSDTPSPHDQRAASLQCGRSSSEKKNGAT